jgi:serine phosphatase RsbU (regulator of sigma subunit)
MLTNEEQKQKLSESIETIQEKNNILEHQNEEITLQRERISEQNILLEERARNIKDSMLYAERIQSAFFLPTREVKKIFPNSFVFIKPKEILSGDIYFIDSIENNIW